MAERRAMAQGKLDVATTDFRGSLALQSTWRKSDRATPIGSVIWRCPTTSWGDATMAQGEVADAARAYGEACDSERGGGLVAGDPRNTAWQRRPSSPTASSAT